MTREELSSTGVDKRTERYRELLGHINAYIKRRAADDFSYALVGTSDWSFSVTEGSFEYPLHMYERAMKEVEATGCTVKRWSFLGFRLGAWTISWGEK